MAAESTATFLFDADGNIDRVRDTEGRVYYLASTLATTAAEAANAAAAKADTAAENADAATSAANNMETARREAETARVEAEKARELAQAKNNADQAANNSAAQGLQVVILGTGEYDPTTLEPTVTGAVGKMYMVPNPDADTDDAYIEWMLISGKWERVGLSNATIETLTTDQIDTVAADGQLVSDSVLNGTGLAYLWAKLRAAFAAIGHKHSVADVTGLQTALDGKAASSHTHNASDVTSGALSIAHGGTGAATAAAARTSLGAASAADLAEVRDSVSQAFLPRGVNPGINGIDYTATAPGCYWVNTEKTPGIYPTGVAYGVLAVFKVDANVLQLMANETSLWWRMNVNDRWSAWRQA